MTATLLTTPDQKEGLSVAYIKALAARAGFSTAVPEPDRDSVDVRIMAGGPRRPALDLQLKATTDLAGAQDGFRRFSIANQELQRSSFASKRRPRGCSWCWTCRRTRRNG